MSRRERRLIGRKLIQDEKVESVQTSSSIGPIGKFFDKHYHKLQIIPLVILLLAISYNIYFYQQTGDFVKKGVSLAGGTTVTVSTAEPVNQIDLEKTLGTQLPELDLSVRVLRSGGTSSGFTVDAATVVDDNGATQDKMVDTLTALYPSAKFSVETTGPSLGRAFFVQTMWAVLAAFVLMGIVVFVSFRTFYPSVAVMLAGFSTVVSTLAVFNMLGFSLSTAGVAAFLMLIGYSIDTDILLSTRVLRRDGEFISNVWSAAKTGLTMQLTTAITVFIVLVFSNNAVFNQIMTIILIGMIFDVLYTWIQNAAILKWYFESKSVKAKLARGVRI